MTDRDVVSVYILLCSETLVSDMRHVSESLVLGFGRYGMLCLSTMPRARGMAAYVRDGYEAFRQTKFECGCCENAVLGVWCETGLICVQSLRQP